MILSDYEDTRFSKMNSFRLSEWVLAGTHYPEVTVYRDNQDKTYHQVCASAKMFRKTAISTDEYAALPYGNWEKLG